MPFSPNPYASRRILPREPVGWSGWSLKRYDILYQVDHLDEPLYAEGLRLAMSALPSPAQTEKRPGVGFVICHHGADWHYIVLNWWDNENELFQRIYLRAFDDDAWRDGAGEGSFCVWDTQVIAFERDTYVQHVLSPHPDTRAYLAAVRAW